MSDFPLEIGFRCDCDNNINIYIYGKRERKKEMVISQKEMSTKESFVFLDAGQSGMCEK